MTDIRVTIDRTKFDIRACGILENNGKILVSNEIDGSQTLSGGAVKIGETTEQTVKREFFEETNLYVEVNELAAIIENHFEIDKQSYQQIIFVYNLSLSEDKQQDLICREKLKVEWLAKDKVTDLKADVLNQLIQENKQGIQHFVNLEHKKR